MSCLTYSVEYFQGSLEGREGEGKKKKKQLNYEKKHKLLWLF